MKKQKQKQTGKYRTGEQMVGLGMDILASCRRLNELLTAAAVEGETVSVEHCTINVPTTGGKCVVSAQVTVNGRR
jgi:hypothetical protein